MEFGKDGMVKGLNGGKVSGKLEYWERKRIERLKGYIEMCERVDWNIGEYERGVVDSENGMLSRKVKTGKKWYRKSDRKK